MEDIIINMHKKEFNLSEKINKVCKGFQSDETIAVGNIKEFIRLLKKELSGWKIQRGISDTACHKIIDKLAGDKFLNTNCKEV